MALKLWSAVVQVVSQDRPLAEYNPADMCIALCRMVAYNIGGAAAGCAASRDRVQGAVVVQRQHAGLTNDRILSGYVAGCPVGQLAHMNATRHGIKRIFFGGFFIRGHPYTMETISYAIRFWSKVTHAAAASHRSGPSCAAEQPAPTRTHLRPPPTVFSVGFLCGTATPAACILHRDSFPPKLMAVWALAG